MSKFSNTSLVVVLIVLIAAFAAARFFQSKKGERNFPAELVTIDSAKVSEILIYPKSKKGEEVRLFKEDNIWKVRLRENKSIQVDNQRVGDVIRLLSELKPVRLAARSAEQWKELEVDTNGTRVIVHEGNRKVLDLIIGKFVFSGGRDMETCVRLNGKNETYAVKGFLEGTFNAGTENWRNKTIIKGRKDQWIKLDFSLGDTLRYTLTKADTLWQVNGQAADKTQVDNYLNQLAFVSGTVFADDVDESQLPSPQALLEISDSSGVAIRIEGFDAGNKKVIRSSLNPDNLFADADGLFDKIFKSQESFVPQSDTISIQ
ncbi:MAG: hypothetical protein KatS3mg031_1905 [Chitinophagales bacterium]|nr:MAG: hypothetical protein KatS3mg031_1905 [Chitinophagales bacterium]